MDNNDIYVKLTDYLVSDDLMDVVLSQCGYRMMAKELEEAKEQQKAECKHAADAWMNSAKQEADWNAYNDTVRVAINKYDKFIEDHKKDYVAAVYKWARIDPDSVIKYLMECMDNMI